MPHILLSSRRHVRDAGLVVSYVWRTYAKIEHGDEGDTETYVFKVLHKPCQLPVFEVFDTRLVLRPIQDGCDLCGKLWRRRLETKELLQGVWRGHGGSFEEGRVGS